MSMCIECDVGGYEFFLRDSFIDYGKSNKALILLLNVSPEYGWMKYLGEDLALERVTSFQIAKYAAVQQIDHEPAFKWMVRHRKRNRIIVVFREL